MKSYQKIKDFGRKHAKQAILTFSALAAGAGLIGTHNHYHPNNEIDHSNIERVDRTIDSTHTEQPDLYDLTPAVLDSLEDRVGQDSTRNSAPDSVDTEINPQTPSSVIFDDIKGSMDISRGNTLNPSDYIPSPEDESVTTTQDRKFYLLKNQYDSPEDDQYNRIITLNETNIDGDYIVFDTSDSFIDVGKTPEFQTPAGVEYEDYKIKIDLNAWNPNESISVYPFVRDFDSDEITESVKWKINFDADSINSNRNVPENNPSGNYETPTGDSGNYSPASPDTQRPERIIDGIINPDNLIINIDTQGDGIENYSPASPDTQRPANSFNGIINLDNLTINYDTKPAETDTTSNTTSTLEDSLQYEQPQRNNPAIDSGHENDESISTGDYPSELYDPISWTNFAFEGLNNQPGIGTLYETTEQERPIEKFSQSVVGNYALNCTENGFEYQNKELESPRDYAEIKDELLDKSMNYRLSNNNESSSLNYYDNIETSIKNICEDYTSNHTLPKEQIELIYDSIIND